MISATPFGTEVVNDNDAGYLEQDQKQSDTVRWRLRNRLHLRHNLLHLELLFRLSLLKACRQVLHTAVFRYSLELIVMS
jgi:hypothetical protein